MIKYFWILILIHLTHSIAIGQNTVGLVTYDKNNHDGYVLFSPMTSTNTYLINKCGEKVHEWNASTKRPALSSYLLNDGSLLRTGKMNNPDFNEGGSGGIIEMFDWNGNLTWSYIISDTNNVLHHDIKVLPNGNILAIVWDRYTNVQAYAMGKSTSYTNPYLWSEKIVEIQPVGTNSANIVWEWKVWDHLVQDFDNSKPNFGVVSNHPELININYFPGQPSSMDWIHLNSIDYNPQTDQILLSSHTLNEIWVIDHSTSTAQAATHSGGNSGKGGDLLYRWGNPQAYQRGNPSTKVFFGQHHATWIPQGYDNAGKILVFNNGLNRPGTYSSIDMIETPINSSNLYPIGTSVAYMPNNLYWTYTDPTPANFYSSNISGVYPLSNGGFIITSGAPGIFFEIDSAKQTKWKYVNPVSQAGILSQGANPVNNVVFRCEFYPLTYPAFSGKSLTSLGEIEQNPALPSLCEAVLNLTDINNKSDVNIFPNPVTDRLEISASLSDYTVDLYDQTGRLIIPAINQTNIDFSHLNTGIYILRITSGDNTQRVFKVIKQ